MAALAAVDSLALFLMLAFPFALDGHGIISDVHRDLLSLQSGKISADGELVVSLVDVDLWSPRRFYAGISPERTPPPAAKTDLIEHPIHLVGHALQRLD